MFGLWATAAAAWGLDGAAGACAATTEVPGLLLLGLDAFVTEGDTALGPETCMSTTLSARSPLAAAAAAAFLPAASPGAFAAADADALCRFAGLLAVVAVWDAAATDAAVLCPPPPELPAATDAAVLCCTPPPELPAVAVLLAVVALPAEADVLGGGGGLR